MKRDRKMVTTKSAKLSENRGVPKPNIRKVDTIHPTF